MLDDKDTFIESIWETHLLREAQALIPLLKIRERDWSKTIRHFMIKYAEDIDKAIAYELGRDENVPR